MSIEETKTKIALIEQDLYDVYDVTLQFRDMVMGGIPKAKELIATWLKARTKGAIDEKEAEKMAKTIAEEVNAESKEEMENAAWTGFKSDDFGIYLEERQIKAAVKECAKTLGMTRRPGFRDGVNHGLFTVPDIIYIMKPDEKGDLQPVPDPEGAIENPIHIMSPRGPRSALKKQDYVKNGILHFSIRVGSPMVTEKDMLMLLVLAMNSGLGSSRSQGFGKFDLLTFEKTHDRKIDLKKLRKAPA